MNIAIFLLSILSLVNSCKKDIALDLGKDLINIVDLTYYKYKLYIFPNSLMPDNTVISEINWNRFFSFKINVNYKLVFVSIKPKANNTVEMIIKLLDTTGDKFIQIPNSIQFTEDYVLPLWLNYKSPQFISQIKNPLADLQLDSLNDVNISHCRNYIEFRTKNGAHIGNFAWNNFISKNLIEHIFSDTIKIIPRAYRKIQIVAYNSLVPDVIYNIGTITFPESYIFPYWFEKVNGCLYKHIMRKLKGIHVDLSSEINDEEVRVHMHLNVFHIYISQEYFDCAFIRSISFYDYNYTVNTRYYQGIYHIFLHKKFDGVEIALALSDKSSNYVKLSTYLLYSDTIKSNWMENLTKNASTIDNLIALDIDLSLNYLLSDIKITQELNSYILEPKFEGLVIFVSVSTVNSFYHIVKPLAEISRVTITYLQNYNGKIKIEINDKQFKTYIEKWRFFRGKNFINFLPSQ